MGETVRKPWNESTLFVQNYLAFLHHRGVPVPKPLGQDDDGRQILEYIPGTMAIELSPLATKTANRIGALVRQVHDASASYQPKEGSIWETAIQAPGTELICHNDLAPWNLVIDGEQLVFIDWDAAAPSTRLWDLAYAASSFCLMNVNQPPEKSAQQLAAFVDGYDAGGELREKLPQEMSRRVHAMYVLLHDSAEKNAEPWASMFYAGHGEHWHKVCIYVDEHQDMWMKFLKFD